MVATPGDGESKKFVLRKERRERRRPRRRKWFWRSSRGRKPSLTNDADDGFTGCERNQRAFWFPERRMPVMLSFTRPCRQSHAGDRWRTGRSSVSAQSLFSLGSFSNGTRFGNFPARLRTATARLGAFPHSVTIFVFFAFGFTSITDVRADATKLMCKRGVS
jgi:hypothetical protein